MPAYNPLELMICIAARQLEDGSSAVVGTGAPCAAAMLSQKRHAPNLVIMFEAGGINPQLPEMPISVGDSRTFHEASMAGSMADIMDACSRGMVDYTFLGGAQIDMYGNLNSTIIGPDPRHPKVRLPGSGGANDVGSLCTKTITLMRHDKLRFVEKLDFLTTPGYLTGPGARERAGLPAETGPYRVITQLGVMGFHEESKEMMLLNVHPGVNVDDVVENTSFKLIIPEKVSITSPPTGRELQLLREEIDPSGIVIGK